MSLRIDSSEARSGWRQFERRGETMHRAEEAFIPPSSMTPRPINLNRIEEELKIVRAVYNQTLERNWGFVPISFEDLLCTAEDMRSIADPAMILIAERAGEPAGVALSLRRPTQKSWTTPR
jgi:hypothetical protein